MTDPIRLRLERWKQQLIDLTLRNRLLNFKPTPVTTIRVVDELPAEVFRTLQIANRSMSFQPASAASVVSVKPVEGLAVISDQEEEATDSGNEFSHVYREQLASHHIDTKLQTSLAPERLAMNLLRIYQQSASLFEEQGASALFLALGMIEWYEDENSDARLKAPLILLPVELNRQNARSKFTLRAAQEDPVVNPAFTEKLKRSFGLKLPPLPEISEDFALEDYFAQVQQLISNEARWRVTNEIHLGLFSFQKFVMYRDLEINEQVFAEHPVITALCLGKGDRLGPLPDELLNAKLDQVLSPETTDHVLDADSSQQRALLAVRSGRDLVLEGPPGTGKSQTIANLIADALASGKRVLFVSEKMAALNVVHKDWRRLVLMTFA
jgi:MoxR-like ATPases